MDLRFRGLPGELVRRLRAKAGDRLHEVVAGLLRAYIDERIDPLSAHDPVAAARGALGGTARAAGMTPEARRQSALAANRARWDRPRQE